MSRYVIDVGDVDPADRDLRDEVDMDRPTRAEIIAEEHGEPLPGMPGYRDARHYDAWVDSFAERGLRPGEEEA